MIAEAFNNEDEDGQLMLEKAKEATRARHKDAADREVVGKIRPDYYGGVDNPYEAIKVIEAWELNFSLGSAVKYISRAGKKDPLKEIEDLEKAETYIALEIKRLKKLRG